jgi:RNA polymerase sigma factor (sigma-70 family)
MGADPKDPTRTRAELERWFDEVLGKYGGAINRLATAYTTGSREREDLVQEIVFAIWQALPQFRGESSERTFVFRIAHNRAISHVTQRRVSMTAVDEEEEIVDVRPDPERAFAAHEVSRQLLEAIRSLPLGHAQVVMLTLEGMSYAEVAEVLGISESNVGARLTRSRDLLRKLLRSPDERP